MYKSKNLAQIKHFYEHYRDSYKGATPLGKSAINQYFRKLKRRIKKLRHSTAKLGGCE